MTPANMPRSHDFRHSVQDSSIVFRINTTLETFDSSVAGIAVDASALTHQVAFTVAQVPNAWVFYLLFITLIVVFILLSFVLTINIIAKCHGIYRLVKAPRSISSIGCSLAYSIYGNIINLLLLFVNKETVSGDSMAGDDLKQPYHRKPYEPSSGHYNVQMGVALPYSSRGAEV
uniref:Uncharacterized protein n=1 Tax=Parascaris equorum TaxID=6256 RepID=A0A914S0Z3_PAREQ